MATPDPLKRTLLASPVRKSQDIVKLIPVSSGRNKLKTVLPPFGTLQFSPIGTRFPWRHCGLRR